MIYSDLVAFKHLPKEEALVGISKIKQEKQLSNCGYYSYFISVCIPYTREFSIDMNHDTLAIDMSNDFVRLQPKMRCRSYTRSVDNLTNYLS